MILMPANSSGSFWHILARETGRLGHLYSPMAQRGPWPWFPYALDNGAFSCWDEKTNTFDRAKWDRNEDKWRQLIFWATAAKIRPRWAIVPDVPGNAGETFARWDLFSAEVIDAGLTPALAVQDGMTPADVLSLKQKPSVICVGGTKEWKWKTIAGWAMAFPRVHLLKCNSPEKLYYLESIGVESCDGTGWNRGDRNQTEGAEVWARSKSHTTSRELISPWLCCRGEKDKRQAVFA